MRHFSVVVVGVEQWIAFSLRTQAAPGSNLGRDIFLIDILSLLLSLWTVMRPKPSSAKKRQILQMQCSEGLSKKMHYKKKKKILDCGISCQGD